LPKATLAPVSAIAATRDSAAKRELIGIPAPYRLRRPGCGHARRPTRGMSRLCQNSLAWLKLDMAIAATGGRA
jgi:hypothetical protein